MDRFRCKCNRTDRTGQEVKEGSKNIENYKYKNYCGKCVPPPPNLDIMLKRVRGNKLLLAEVVASFARDVDKHHARMDKALVDQDAQEISRLAHGFKGVLGTMEAQEAHQIAVNLEKAARENDFDNARRLFSALMEQIGHMAAYFSEDHNRG